jgi:uncharacterized protein (DUF2235 family)
MAKRLVICCDGTWNTAGQKCPTNVTDFHRTVAPQSADGTKQESYYHPGVGTSRWERLRGGAFGWGLSKIVKDAYRLIVDNYEPGDELFLLGFSRGAFTARSTAGLVRNAGILRPDQAARIDDAYALYRSAEGPDSPAAVAFRAAHALSDQTPIRFIGVWDTVGALGVPNLGLPGTAWLNRRWAFHDVKLSSRVVSAFQALAIDEARRPFEPTLWQPQSHAVGQELEQVWFAGVHCDVGGGYPDRGLAEITLWWMKDRARRCGLAFTDDPAAPLDENLAGSALHDSRTGMYRLLPPYHRQLGRTDPVHEAASSTVVARYKAGDYAPKGFTDYLKRPDHNEVLV